MQFGTYVACAVRELVRNEIFAGKTNIQKIIYFALPTEQRKMFYHPYYYGPYCEEVQQATSALLKNKILKRDGKGFSVSKKWGDVAADNDQVMEQMRIDAQFLAKHGLFTTDNIAQLAKVHLLSHTKREDAKRDLPAYIQSQARFLGWKELARTNTQDIKEYLDFAKKLEEGPASLGEAA